MSAERVSASIRAKIARGLTKACIHLNNKAKVLISVPAPRERVTSRTGSIYWRATTPATPGAPPRKLSGNLRRSVTYMVDKETLVGRVGTSVNYGRHLENGDH